MAKEAKIYEVIQNAGYEPIRDRCIVVTYGYSNLSDLIARFFSNEFYVLQMCKNELVLVPFGKWSMTLKKEVTLSIPYDSIKSINIVEDGLNYRITIQRENEEIVLSAQQKELSDVRVSGALADYNQNWHKENLDDTLKSLKNLKN